MNFAELSRITGKKSATLKQAFYRRGLSIKKEQDIQTFIQQPRKKRSRKVEHLSEYQFHTPTLRRGSRAVEQWIENPRVVGSISTPATKNMDLMKQVAKILLTEYRDIQGVMFFGSRVMSEDHSKSDLDLLMVVNDRPGVMKQIDAAKLSLAQLAEKLNCEIQALHIDPETLAASRLQIDPLLNFALRRGRIEFGISTIPVVPNLSAKAVIPDAQAQLEDFQMFLDGRDINSLKISKKEALSFLKKFIALRFFLEKFPDINLYWRENFLSLKSSSLVTIKDLLINKYVPLINELIKDQS